MKDEKNTSYKKDRSYRRSKEGIFARNETLFRGNLLNPRDKLNAIYNTA